MRSVGGVSCAMLLLATVACSWQRPPCVPTVRGHRVPLLPQSPATVVVPPDSRFILDALGFDTPVDVLVDLPDRVDWDRFEGLLDAEQVPVRERAAWVREALSSVLESQVRELRDSLASLRKEDLPAELDERFLVLRRVRLSTNRSGAEMLAGQAGIERVQAIHPAGMRRGGAEIASPAPSTSQPGSTWGLEYAGVPVAWGRGLHGEGRRIAILDGGVSARHEAIAAQFEEAFRWDGEPRPGNHGTAVLSAALGRSPTGEALGPAPEARWLAADPFPAGAFDPLGFSRCSDWILEKEPDVVVLPWESALPAGEEDMVEAMSAWRTAGVLVVVAAGNTGPVAGANVAPGNLGGIGPGHAPAFSVGAVDGMGRLYAYSARGPSSSTGKLFPMIVAPGTGLLLASDPPAGYLNSQGTSFSAGLTAGVAALLRQAHPDRKVPEIEEALTRSARDAGEPGPDMSYGYGILDVEAALDWLSTHPPHVVGADAGQ